MYFVPISGVNDAAYQARAFRHGSKSVKPEKAGSSAPPSETAAREQNNEILRQQQLATRRPFDRFRPRD